MEANAFVSMETLLGISGASSVTTVIVSVLKKIFGKRMSSQLMSLIVAMFITIVTCILTDGRNPQSYFLAFIDAFIVAAASNGIYDASSKIRSVRKK